MQALLITLIVIVAVLLIVAVLIQNSKGSAGPAGGGASAQLLGVSKSGDILEKITLGLGAAMVTFILAINFTIEKPNQGDGPSSANLDKASEMGGAPAPAIQQSAVGQDTSKK